MLVFTDADHFQEVYDCLEAAVEAHLDVFEAQWGYLSEDDFDNMAEQLGFVDEQPLIDFENALVFTSYRKVQAALEDAWLDAGGDPSDGPFQTDLFHDDVMATLMNTEGAVMIGGDVLLMLPDGEVISFCD
jgi:hypothetical protein